MTGKLQFICVAVAQFMGWQHTAATLFLQATQSQLTYCHNNNNGHYTRQPASAGTSSTELEDFVGAKFYCPHVLADGNQRIRIRQKTLECYLHSVIYTVFVLSACTTALYI